MTAMLLGLLQAEFDEEDLDTKTAYVGMILESDSDSSSSNSDEDIDKVVQLPNLNPSPDTSHDLTRVRKGHM